MTYKNKSIILLIKPIIHDASNLSLLLKGIRISSSASKPVDSKVLQLLLFRWKNQRAMLTSLE